MSGAEFERAQIAAEIKDIAEQLPDRHLTVLLEHAHSLRRAALQVGIYYRRDKGHGAGLTEQSIELLQHLPEDKQRIVYHFITGIAGKA